MKILKEFASLIIISSLLAASMSDSHAVPTGYKLAWSDEFNGPIGSLPSSTNWNYDDGPGYNNELEINKVNKSTCTIVTDSDATDRHALQITGTPIGDGKYNSARINTKAKYSTQYGYIEARMKIPYGNGMWPAFWLLGNNIDAVNWPKCGEVDIMENIGKTPSMVYGSIHFPNDIGAKYVTTAYATADNEPLSSKYHIYAIDWKPGKMTFYLDNHIYANYTPTSMPNGAPWCYDSQPFYIILNLAIGGDWPGSPDAATQFPAKLMVDYVRVYKAPSH